MKQLLNEINSIYSVKINRIGKQIFKNQILIKKTLIL